jgi:hypothetical protein
VTLLEVHRQLGPSVVMTQQRAEHIVTAALPHAVSALGENRELRVHARQVSAEASRGGSLIPAWPLRDEHGGVTIEYVADWGALLAGWMSAVQPAERSLALQLVRQRTWIGIANDVLQLFVPDPPPGTYSMVRHHGLMLAAATTWLGPEAVSQWRIAHASVARDFLNRHADARLWDVIHTAERGLDSLLSDTRTRQPAVQALTWLDSDPAARQKFVDYLGAASLGVLAVLDALAEPGETSEVWLRRVVAEWHPDPDFNRSWIEASAHMHMPRLALER